MYVQFVLITKPFAAAERGVVSGTFIDFAWRILFLQSGKKMPPSPLFLPRFFGRIFY